MKKPTSTIHIKLLSFLTIFCILLSFFGCSPGGNNKHLEAKTSDTDPFKNSMVKSEFFEISGKEDQTVEGKNGTVLVLPKGCFKNGKGEVVEGNVKIEMAEALSSEDMVLSNLTTSSDGKLLESAGMLYINATSNGEQLTVNPENPIYIEMAKDGSYKNMEIYTGVRDKDGKMNWIDPKPLPKYLIPVDMSTLHFFPEGFENGVDAGMPFRSYKLATDELKDSLYFSLSQYSSADSTIGVSIEVDPNIKLVQYEHTEMPEGSRKSCGIDPASIKVLKSKKFENSFISTREFEKRLQAIFKTCDNSILEIYINNLDKDLWKLDEAVFQKLGESHKMYPTFKSFSEEKLTNVKAADKNALLLKKYYEKQLKKVKAELLKIKKAALEQLKKEDEKAARMRVEYAELLEKREKYRMEKFGFERKELGWINVAQKITLQDLETFELVVEVPEGKEFDRVNTYIVNPRIKSLFSLISDDKTIFDKGYDKDKHLLMWKNQNALAIVIAYKGETPYYGLKDFSVKKVNLLKISLLPSSEKEVRDMLKDYSSYKKENKIELDLKFQKAFYQEEKRQERLAKEKNFIEQLRQIAFPCCDELLGQQIFINNCSSCHAPFQTVVGPPLYGLEKKRSMSWIFKFIRNSQKLIKEDKDKDAIESYEKHNNTVMTSFPSFSDKEILSIFTYLNSLPKDNLK